MKETWLTHPTQTLALPTPFIFTCGSPSLEPCNVEKSNIQTKLLIHPFM